MTKNDYIRVAFIINAHVQNVTVPTPQLEVLRQVADDLAGAFYQDNQRFNYATFIKACGLEVSE